MHRRTLARTAFAAILATLLSGAPPALAQVKRADELVRDLRPRAFTRGLRVEDAPKPATDVIIAFEYNSARLSQDSLQQLTELARAFTGPELASSRYRIVGHTDAVGSDAFNLDLSRRRAAAVVGFLTDRLGVRREQLLADGRGERELKYPDQPEHAGNRRVEIRFEEGM